MLIYQVDISMNGKLIANGGDSPNDDCPVCGGDGGIIHLIVMNILHLDANAISVREGTEECPRNTGFILIEHAASKSDFYTFIYFFISV